MKIQLSDHFTYRRLLRFVLSPVLMMIFTSLYSIVDGFFISNYVGKTPFAAVNLIMPVSMGVGTIGFMVGTGGSAIVSKTLGEGKKELANKYFSMMIYFAILLSLALSVIGFIFTPQICTALGAKGELHRNCVIYGRILFLSETAFVLQYAFQSFFVAAEKPGLTLKISIAAGLTNAFLDFLFIVVFRWGIAGAAAATALGQVVGGILPLLYFSRKNTSLLRLVKTPLEPGILKRTCFNGASEMVTNLSGSIVNILYNFQLMRIAGENGVAAYGVIMYANFLFMAVFFGYSIGSAPIISFHYGAGKHSELKNLFRKSLLLMGICGIAMTLFSELFAAPLVKIFAGYDADLYAMTVRGFQLYCFSFLLMGINVFASAFFTALSNGGVSAAISFLRTFLLQIAAVLLLPLFLGIDGIWLAVVAAELLTLVITIVFLVKNADKYHYA